MKKIKFYSLVLLSTALVALATIYSCSNEETRTESSPTLSARLNKEGFQSYLIATLKNDEAILSFDSIRLEEGLLIDVFGEIESIGIDHGFDPEANRFEAYLTIIGKERINFDLLSFQAELVKDGDDLFMLVPDDFETTPSGLFTTHTCAGENCRSCQYERSGFLNLKITGCKPCGAINDPDKPGYCNHSINGGNVVKVIKEIKDIAS